MAKPSDEERRKLLENGLRAIFEDPDDRSDFGLWSILEALGDGRGGSTITLDDIPGEKTPVVRPLGELGSRHPPRIGRFRVDGEIARGGVGVVLKARDVDLGRSIAVKLLLEEHRDNPDVTRRFVEEAQIAGQLHHPGIVGVHEMGLLGGKRPYFVMKLVKGQTLAALLESRDSPSVDRHRFLGIFERICQALAYAHTRGVIHRDLKPSNVMTGAFGEVRVMDWGLAKVLVQGDDRRARQAQEDRSDVLTVRTRNEADESLLGSVMGTPAYMSPEQALGLVNEIDERSDVFGLGAILCEILTGSPPYVASSASEMHGLAKLGDVSEAMVRLDATGAEHDVICLAKQCLEFERDRRPSSAGVIADALRSHFESLEERAHSLEIKATAAEVKAREERKAHRLTVLLALISFGAIAVAGAGYLWLESQRLDRVAQAENEVQQSIQQADALRIDAASGPDKGLGKLREALAALGKAEELASADLTASKRAHLRGRLEDLQRELDGRELIARLDALRTPALDVDPVQHHAGFEHAFRDHGLPVLSMTPEQAAAALRARGNAAELALAIDDWAMYRRRSGMDESERWKDLLRLAEELDPDSWRRRLRRAAVAEDASELRGLADASDVRKLSDLSVFHLARHLEDAGDRDRAESVLTRAQPFHIDSYWINFHLGQMLYVKRRYEASRRYLTAAVALRPDIARNHSDLGTVCYMAGDFETFLSEYATAIRLLPENPLYYEDVMNIAFWREDAVFGDALDDFRRQLSELIDSGVMHHPIARRAFVFAWTFRPDRLDETRALAWAIEDVEKSGGRDPEALSVLARVHHARGRHRDVVLRLEDALRLTTDAPQYAPDLLRDSREKLLPDLVSYASIDALFDRVDPDRFRNATSGEDARWRIAYFEARHLEADGDHEGAARKLREVARAAPAVGEPLLRLAACLAASGRGDEAERELRGGLEGALDRFEIWRAWLALSLAELGRPPSTLLRRFPKTAAVPSRWSEDARWLLEQLAAGVPLRLNCGGNAYESRDGVSWGRDRFFTRGDIFNYGTEQFFGSISGTNDAPLFTTERWFGRLGEVPAAYTVPLPRGRYRVALHFAEIYYPCSNPGGRVFDVFLEGEKIADDLDLAVAAGYVKAYVLRGLEVAVEDGVLDIAFGAEIENPKISAIEIEPLAR